MACKGKLLYLGIILLTAFILPKEAISQHSKKSKITDGFGPLVGINYVFFYPKDQNNHPADVGNPELLPGGMIGLSYYHTFNPRWTQLFQLRISDHQIKYWKATNQTWHLNHERVEVKSDSGDYHMKYRVVSMNYMIGWRVNKKIGWNVYTGLQLNHTVINRSTKTVDGVVNGTIDFPDYIPYPNPEFYYDSTSITYSPDIVGEILLRTDVNLKLSDQWTIRPVLEFGLNTGVAVQTSIKNRVAFYLEIYKQL